MEILTALPSEYQQWLLSKNYLVPFPKETYENCPLMSVRAEWNPTSKLPKYLALAEVLHEQPLVVVDNSTLRTEIYKDPNKGPKSLNILAWQTRNHGCSSTNISGFGVSVGIRKLALTPLQVNIVYELFIRGREGLSRDELLEIIELRRGSEPFYIDNSDNPDLLLRHATVEMHRLKEDKGVRIKKARRWLFSTSGPSPVSAVTYYLDL